MPMKFAPVSYRLGVEVQGLDVSQPISDATFEELYRAFLDADGIMLLRDQQITREQHIAFSRRFGELDRHDSVPMDRDPSYPELLMVSNKPRAGGATYGKAIGQVWHSDLAPSLVPASTSLLRAIEVPTVGGDTMFANMYAAYDSLSVGMKRLIADLHAVHVRKRKDVTAEWEEENRRLNPPVAHPVVRIHPETERKALYIGEVCSTFEGMKSEESLPLINYLVAHATQPQFVYRHRWQANDILIWDNRCTMHLALGDYDQSQWRHLERTTVVGTQTGHLCQPDEILSLAA